MKLVLAAAAALSALALSSCGMLGEEGPAPGTPAAKAPEALPPPSMPAPVAAPATPAQPEDLTPVPADQVKCIPPYILKTVAKDGQTEARCVAPSEAAPKPN